MPANRTANGSEPQPGSASGEIRQIRAGATLAAGAAARGRRRREHDRRPLHRGDSTSAPSRRAAARAVQALPEGSAGPSRLRAHGDHDDLPDAGGVRRASRPSPLACSANAATTSAATRSTSSRAGSQGSSWRKPSSPPRKRCGRTRPPDFAVRDVSRRRPLHGRLAGRERDSVLRPAILTIDVEDWHQLVHRRLGRDDWDRARPEFPRQMEALVRAARRPGDGGHLLPARHDRASAIPP